MKLMSFLAVLVPYTIWIVVSAVLVFSVPNPLPSFYTDNDWTNLLVMNAPLVTWLVLGFFDGMGFYEGDSKAGKVNLAISWLIMIIFFLTNISYKNPTVYAPQLIVLLVISGFNQYYSFIVEGTFRRWLSSQINIIKYGVDWKPSKLTNYGSASFAHNPTAAVYYHDKDVIFGTALSPQPNIENTVTRYLREKYLAFSAYMAGRQAYRQKWNKSLSPQENKDLAIKGFSTNPKESPILSTSIDGHMFVVSGSGGGKTASFGIPNALWWKGGSFVCIDPKSEVYEVTGEARRKLGHTTYKLQPDSEDTDTFNAIGWLSADSSTFTSDCMTVSSWIFPEKKNSGGDGGAEFYKQKAKDMFALVLAKIIAEHWQDEQNGEVRPFPTLRDAYKFLIRSDAEIRKDIEDLYKKLGDLPPNSQFFGSSTEQIKEWCGPFVGGDVERTYPNIVASVTKEIFWLGDPTASSIVTGKPVNPDKGRSFNAQEILTGKTSIYICIPLEILTSTPSLARLAIGGFRVLFSEPKVGRKGKHCSLWMR